MRNWAQLEIRIDAVAAASADRVRVQMSLRVPGAVREPLIFDVAIPYESLDGESQSPTSYGRALAEGVFASPAAELVEEARRYAREADIPLRLLLIMDPLSPAAALRWETLAGPDGRPLALEPDVYLTRFFEVRQLPPHLAQANPYPSAVIAVANPSNLPSIHPQAHVRRATDGLRGVSRRVLSETGCVTLARLQAALRDLRPDILYLVCHGDVGPGGPRLWLEQDDGSAHEVPVADLLRVLDEHVPRLVILGSCHGAGDGRPGEFIAPMLARAGVAAVLAFNGQLSTATLDRFIGEFFREIRRSGRLEHAVSTARRLVSLAEREWPQPVLHSRLTEDELLLQIRDAPAMGACERWPMLMEAIAAQRCIPVLGWDCDATVLGSEAELALAISARFKLPVLAEDTRRMGEVARILVAMQNRDLALAVTREELLRQVTRRNPANGDPRPAELGSLVCHLSRAERVLDPDHPLRVLAELPADLFITTSWFPTLRDALIEAGKDPFVDVFPWNPLIQPPGVRGAENAPSVARPQVLHLAGLWEMPDSVVLTDDDQHSLAAALALDHTPDFIIPWTIRGHAARRNLLVCGTDIADPLLRMLLKTFHRWTPGHRHQARHVVVLPEPVHADEEHASRASGYIDGYLNGLDAFRCWGAVAQFARQLRSERERRNA